MHCGFVMAWCRETAKNSIQRGCLMGQEVVCADATFVSLVADNCQFKVAEKAV
jgi:hypothetical protein